MVQLDMNGFETPSIPEQHPGPGRNLVQRIEAVEKLVSVM